MNETVQHLFDIGEPLAAGLLEYPNGPLELTYCRGYRRFFENCTIVYRKGAPLFPTGEYMSASNMAVYPIHSHPFWIEWDHLEKKSSCAVEIMKDYTSRYYYPGEWNHSMLNYKRILAEGIDQYERRLLSKKESNFRTGLLDLIEGIRAYHRRALEVLPSMGAPKMLIDALNVVPFSPATNAYEAIVALNFCLSLDDWDNVGRLDSILEPYYNGEDMRPYLRCLFQSMQDRDRWSITLGPDYSDITYQALEASVGMARPLIELRVTDDMPKELWELASKRILEGGGQPALYNEKAIQERFFKRIPTLPEADALEFAGGGCTETSFAGLTYAGGTDININVLKIFEEYMHRELPRAKSFEEFYEGFNAVLRSKQDEQMAHINSYWNERTKTAFSPIRSLFIDDCIDNEKGWFQGGARYSFSISSDSGMPNTIDSLLAIRHLIYDEKRYTPEKFLELLSNEDADFYAELRSCPAYGMGEQSVRALVKDFTTRFYEHYLTGKLDLGLGFFPTIHQFTRHIGEGRIVGPTPDGRHGGEPEADSLAAVNGKAEKGPTVMLSDAACYEQKDAYGMAVTNLSITRKYTPEVLRALVEGYFALGGTQLQITAVDRDTLLDAKEHPDKHRDLIVRVGGYSDYFCNLSKNLQNAIIDRTLFE